jgi:Immunoglobulin I-set domain.
MIWLKDGQRIIRADEGLQHGGARLTVPSVQREDQGMYQCIASSDGESVQAVAELRLGGEYRLHGRNSFTEGCVCESILPLGHTKRSVQREPTTAWPGVI